MTSGQHKGLILLLFVVVFFGDGVGVKGAVHAFDLTCKFHLDKQLGLSCMHTHMCKCTHTETHTEPKREKKICNYFYLNHSVQITGKNPV